MAQTTPPDPAEHPLDASATGAATPRLDLLHRFRARMHRHPVTSLLTKVVVTVVGVSVVVAGFVMMVTPGPGLVTVLLGLAILATEFTWAEALLATARRKAHDAARAAREMDPAVRRRRLLLTGVAVLVVVGLGCGYLYQFGWPGLALDGWDRMQSIATFLPDLPGT